MPKFLANLTEEQLVGLRELSQSTGASVSFYIREAVSDYLSRGEPCGLVTSGQVVSGRVYLVGGVR